MAVQFIAEVFRLDLPSTEKLVLLALADAANDEGMTWIPVKRRGEQLDRYGRKKLDLLIKTSLSERAVQGAIKRLVTLQLLKRNEIVGRGVQYMITPAGDAGAQEMRPAGGAGTPAANAGKPLRNRSTSLAKANSVQRTKGSKSGTVAGKGKSAGSGTTSKGTKIAEDWWPHKPGPETAKETATWPEEFMRREVERFIGHHRSKGTVSKDWNRQWATWALGPYCAKALREWNDERNRNGQSGSAFGRAAATALARERAGANPL